MKHKKKKLPADDDTLDGWSFVEKAFTDRLITELTGTKFMGEVLRWVRGERGTKVEEQVDILVLSTIRVWLP